MQTPSDDTVVRLGKIVGAFGVKGWVKVESFTSERLAIFDYKPWLIWLGNKWCTQTVLNGRDQGKGLIAHLQGIDDRDEAQALAGCPVGVYRDQLPTLTAGEYYWLDLIGLEVITVDAVSLGKISYLLETGANDVMVVQGERERWLPWLLDSVVKKVDLDKRVVHVDWDPEF